MAKFFIDQRVRIVKAVHYPQLLGTEATIISIKPNAYSRRTGERWFGYVISSDLWNGSYITPDGRVLTPAADCLEPIIDTYETTTWESMRHLWVPEHMREQA